MKRLSSLLFALALALTLGTAASAQDIIGAPAPAPAPAVVAPAASPAVVDPSPAAVVEAPPAAVDPSPAAVVEAPPVVEEAPAIVETPPVVAETPPVVIEQPQPQPQPDPQPAPAAGGKPKIAIYVTGGKDVGENKALGTRILSAILKSGRFTAVERTEAFIAEIDREMVRQHSGAVDDEQISRLGRQSGVNYVCVADITSALGSYQVSARIIDVETALVLAVGMSDSQLKTMEDLGRAASKVIEEMFDTFDPEAARLRAKALARGKRVRFGVRLAYVNSFVVGYTAERHDFDFDANDMELTTTEYKGGGGHGVEFGLAGRFALSPYFSVNPSVSLIFRTPVVTDLFDISELAVGAGVTGRQKFIGGLYGGLGADFAIPVATSLKWKVLDDEKVDVAERSSFGVGAVVEAGCEILSGLTVDLRVIYGLGSFDDEKGRPLVQVLFGASYLF